MLNLGARNRSSALSRARRAAGAAILATSLSACGPDAVAPSLELACATAPHGREVWPAWDPAGAYAERVAHELDLYETQVHDWRFYHQPGGYQSGGEYMFFSSFATLGPDTKYDDAGVPMVLNAGAWVYNPVTISNFALYHHTLHRRGAPLAPEFWNATAKLLAMQGPDGAFRYDYAFDTMEPGWVSAMAQGQALSVFSRAYLLSGDTKYVAAGNASLAFLLTPVEAGGVRGDLGDLHPSLRRYLSLYEYDYSVSPHTLNGFIFALFGLYDWAQLGESVPEAGVEQGDASYAFQCGVHTVASTLHYYDIGGFSTYDMKHVLGFGGISAGPTYHKIHIVQAVALYSVAPRPEFLAWATTWADRVGQPIP